MRQIPTAKYVFYTVFYKHFITFLRHNFRNNLPPSSPRGTHPACHGAKFPESQESSLLRTSYSGKCSDRDHHLHFTYARKLAELQLLQFL